MCPGLSLFFFRASGATTTLSPAQLGVYYYTDGAAHTWKWQREQCHGRGQTLCSYDEICPTGHGSDPAGGVQPGGDRWTPALADTMVQIGDGSGSFTPGKCASYLIHDCPGGRCRNNTYSTLKGIYACCPPKERLDICGRLLCNSPKHEDENGVDCLAGLGFEACTCSAGALARTTGQTVTIGDVTYTDYMCCTGASGVGETCGDCCTLDLILAIAQVVLSIIIVLMVIIWIGCCKRNKRCCFKPAPPPPAPVRDSVRNSQNVRLSQSSAANLR